MIQGSVVQVKPVASKRNFFRVPLRLKIEVNAGLPVMLPALLLDISGGGCQIASRLLVEKGQQVSYNLKRGEGKSDLRLCGVIRAKRYSEAEHVYFYGIKFEGLKEADHEALLSEITALERRIIMHNRSESQAQTVKKIAPNRGGNRPRMRAHIQHLRGHRECKFQNPLAP